MNAPTSANSQAVEGVERGFACPHAGLDQALLELIVVEHARQTLEAFLDRHGKNLERAGSGLVEQLARARGGTLTFETLWDPAIGGIHAALLRGDADADRRAAAAALRLHECGYPGQWEIRLGSPAIFRVGRWMVPAVGAAQLFATDSTLRLRVGKGAAARDITFDRRETGWDTESPHAVALPTVPGRPWVVWKGELISSWEFDGLRESLSTDDPAPLLDGCGSACVTLMERGGIYRDWVNRVIRHLVPWEAEPGQYPSGSSSASCAPGVIGIGNHRHALALADTLAHEATHQYFYVAGRLGAMDDGSDRGEYYNPFLEMKRPIGRILLAYHAFANIVLLCRTLRANGLEHEPYLVNREEYLVPRLAILEEALSGTRALTPLGRSIAEALMHEVHGPTVRRRRAALAKPVVRASRKGVSPTKPSR